MLVGALVGAMSASAGVAAAAERSGCGGAWADDGAECSFIYKGGSVSMGIGLRSELFGATTVRLERDTALGRDIIWACPAFGQWSVCGASAASSEDFTDIGGKLYCVVVGRGGRGNYSCASGGD